MKWIISNPSVPVLNQLELASCNIYTATWRLGSVITLHLGEMDKKKTVRDRKSVKKKTRQHVQKKWLKVRKNTEWGTSEVRENGLRVYELKSHREEKVRFEGRGWLAHFNWYLHPFHKSSKPTVATAKLDYLRKIMKAPVGETCSGWQPYWLSAAAIWRFEAHP